MRPALSGGSFRSIHAKVRELALARTAEVAAESYATDHAGSYAGLTPAALNALEPSIQTVQGGDRASLSAASGTRTGYTVTAMSGTGAATFSVVRTGRGSVARTCTPASGLHGACVNGSW